MSKSPFFQISSRETKGIYDKIVNTFDVSRLEQELVIKYEKFPANLPPLDDVLDKIFEEYYDNLGNEGYRYNTEGTKVFEKYLVVCPKWEERPWTKGLGDTSFNKINTINIHIYLNTTDLSMDYFCPFNDDIVAVPFSQGTVVVYPDFWGSIFKHCSTYEKPVAYLRCVAGIPR